MGKGPKNTNKQTTENHDQRVVNEIGIGGTQDNFEMSLGNITTTGTDNNINLNMRDQGAMDMLQDVLIGGSELLAKNQESNASAMSNTAKLLGDNKNDNTSKTVIAMSAVAGVAVVASKLLK